MEEGAVTRELVPGHQSLTGPCEQHGKANHHFHSLPLLWHPLMLSPQFLLPPSVPSVTAPGPEPEVPGMGPADHSPVVHPHFC